MMETENHITKKQLFYSNIPLAITFLIALILWIIFYPAYMNADSIVQYSQAVTGIYEDWHPPIMAIIVHYMLIIGGGIGTITLIQSVGGCLGIYLLGKEILTQHHLSENKCKWIPLYILIFLLLPISPLPFYLMTFIKDTWIAIGLLWIAYWAIRTMKINDKNTKQYRRNYIALVLLMTLMFITRHNAIVLLPLFSLLLFFHSKRLTSPKEHWLPIILWSMLPLFIYIVMQKQLYAGYQIKKMYPEHQVMALESVGALITDTNAEKHLPYIKSHLTLDYKNVYYPGNVASVMNWAGSEKTLNQATFNIVDERISKEYIQYAFHEPLALMKIKAAGFYNMIKPNRGKYWYHIQLDPNSFGLVQNELFKGLRLGWQNIADVIRKNAITSFIGAEHIVWLSINLIFIIVFIIKKKIRSILFIVLLLPLGYYFSYLLACTGDEFRFMYPSTLLVQVLALNLMLIKTKKNATTTLTNS